MKLPLLNLLIKQKQGVPSPWHWHLLKSNWLADWLNWIIYRESKENFCNGSSSFVFLVQSNFFGGTWKTHADTFGIFFAMYIFIASLCFVPFTFFANFSVHIESLITFSVWMLFKAIYNLAIFSNMEIGSTAEYVLFLLLPYHFYQESDKTIAYDKLNKKRFALSA